MLRIFSLRLTLLLGITLGFNSTIFAQNDPIEGKWYNDKKSAKIHIYKGDDNKFYGKIVWLKKPDYEGKPKTDANNPDPAKRTQPIIGLVILKGFEKDGRAAYEDGTVYDPKSGKVYSSKMKLEGNTLDVRGYIGVSMMGRSTTWTRAEN